MVSSIAPIVSSRRLSRNRRFLQLIQRIASETRVHAEHFVQAFAPGLQRKERNVGGLIGRKGLPAA